MHVMHMHFCTRRTVFAPLCMCKIHMCTDLHVCPCMCAMQAVSGGGICFLERAHVSDGLLDCCCGQSWHKEARTPGHPKVPSLVPSLYLGLVRRKLGTCCSLRGVWRLPQNVSERQTADITGATAAHVSEITGHHTCTCAHITAAHGCTCMQASQDIPGPAYSSF